MENVETFCVPQIGQILVITHLGKRHHFQKPERLSEYSAECDMWKLFVNICLVCNKWGLGWTSSAYRAKIINDYIKETLHVIQLESNLSKPLVGTALMSRTYLVLFFGDVEVYIQFLVFLYTRWCSYYMQDLKRNIERWGYLSRKTATFQYM